jgi:hypothetical protein
MNYPLKTIFKAVATAVVAFIGTAIAAAGGPDLSHLQVDQWVDGLIPAVIAGLALLHKPDTTKDTPNTKAAATVTDVVTSALTAHTDLVQQAVDGIKAVQTATGELTKLLPGPLQQVEQNVLSDVQRAANNLGLGPLASQVISRVRL